MSELSPEVLKVLDQLEAEYEKSTEFKQPEGSFTVKQYAQHKGISARWAQEKLSRMIKEGLVEIVATHRAVYYYRATPPER
jgi:Fic family protein